jgi:hypothetical protein
VLVVLMGERVDHVGYRYCQGTHDSPGVPGEERAGFVFVEKDISAFPG